MSHSLRVIARLHSDFSTKFGVPRQSGLVEALRAAVIFEPEFRVPEAVRGLEEFSHLWLIWQFSQNQLWTRRLLELAVTKSAQKAQKAK